MSGNKNINSCRVQRSTHRGRIFPLQDRLDLTLEDLGGRDVERASPEPKAPSFLCNVWRITKKKSAKIIVASRPKIAKSKK